MQSMTRGLYFLLARSGDPKTRNGGMTERRKITPNPKTRNGGKSPQILKRGMAENPKTQNGGKS